MKNKWIVLCLSLLVFSPSCKTSKKDTSQSPSGVPFTNPLQFFNGVYDRFESTYTFSPEKKYAYYWKDKTGSFVEQGTFNIDADQKMLYLTPSLIQCSKDQKITTIDLSSFKVILDEQRLALMAAYERRATDPDGLNDLLKKLQDEQASNEKTSLSQELAKDLESKNITKMEDFLKMIKGLRIHIEDEHTKISKNQEIVDKNQKRVDMILQEKIENKVDKTAIATLNAEKAKIEADQIAKKAEIQASIDEIDHTNKKIKTLLEEYPLSEQDLKEALGHLKNIDDYLKYAKERAVSLQAQESSLMDLIKNNEQVLDRLKNFSIKIENTRPYFFEINQVKMFLDNQKINPASVAFSFQGTAKPAHQIAECHQSALIFLTKYLENK